MVVSGGNTSVHSSRTPTTSMSIQNQINYDILVRRRDEMCIRDSIKCDLVKHSNLRDCISPKGKLTITLRLSSTYTVNH